MQTKSSATCVQSLLQFLACSIAILWTPGILAANVLYRQDFEGATFTSLRFSESFGSVGFPGAEYDRGITATGGTNDSQGFSYTFSARGASSYHFSFGRLAAAPANDANPLGGISNLHFSQIRFSMDIKAHGNVVNRPVQVSVFQSDADYEANRGEDANGDGDTVDSATNFYSLFEPTIVNGGDFMHASYTLDQGLTGGSITRFLEFPPIPIAEIPLDPEFDSTLPLNWRISFDSQGFGLDSGNAVSVDNILIESVVPEPVNAMLIGIGAAVAIFFRLLRCGCYRP